MGKLSELSKSESVRGYVDAQMDGVKFQLVKGLAGIVSSVASFLLLFILGGTLLTALSFALVLWLGEVLHSYAIAAFIVSGGLAVLLLLVILLRKALFRNTFISAFAGMFFPGIRIRDHRDLEMAQLKNDVRIQKEEAELIRSFFNPASLLHLILSLFSGKKKSRK